jgi:hypothetical protein
MVPPWRFSRHKNLPNIQLDNDVGTKHYCFVGCFFIKYIFIPYIQMIYTLDRVPHRSYEKVTLSKSLTDTKLQVVEHIQ